MKNYDDLLQRTQNRFMAQVRLSAPCYAFRRVLNCELVPNEIGV